MRKPLVSIMIPSYNYGQYLGGCIESAINQTYPNFEIILRDNRSTDSSYDLALKYQKICDQKNIYMFVARNKSNIGSSGNSEKCYYDSEGEFFFWLSADDEIKPTFVEQAVDVLLKYPNVGMVMSHRDEVDENGKITETPPFYNRSCVIPGEDQAAVFMMAGIAVPSQILHRKSTYMTMLRGKTLRFQVAGDWYDNFMMSCFADVAYIKEPLCRYRVHSGNETSDSELNLLGVFEHYQLINSFKWISESYGMKKPALRYDDAARKLGDMCLRYAFKMYKNERNDVAGKYLQLAPVFKPSIIDDETYKAFLSYFALSGKELKEELNNFEMANPMKRVVSYDPPEGAISL